MLLVSLLTTYRRLEEGKTKVIDVSDAISAPARVKLGAMRFQYAMEVLKEEERLTSDDVWGVRGRLLHGSSINQTDEAFSAGYCIGSRSVESHVGKG